MTTALNLAQPRVAVAHATSASALLAWALTLAMPLGVFSALSTRLSHDAAMLLALMVGAAIHWVFRVVPDFVIGLLLLWLCVLLGLAPAGLAFSGFTSPVFLLVLGVFLLSALLTESPWMAHWSDLLLRYTQGNTTARLGAVVLTAIILTLVLPSPLGRSALLAPLLQPLAGARSPRFQTAVVFAMAQGNTLWSTAFLTGNPLNFVLLGMLDVQAQQRFQWLSWLAAAAAFALVAALGLAVLLACLLYRSDPQVPPGGQQPATQAPLPPRERQDAAVPVLYALLFLVVLTRPYHQIELHLAVGALALMGHYLAPMSLQALRMRLDWPTLLFIATLAAWQPMLHHTGIDRWLASYLPLLARLAHTSVVVNVIGVSLMVGLVRLVMPGAPAFIVLASSLLPLAPALGLSPWALGFVLLTASEGFVLAHQHGVLSHLLSEAQSLGMSLDQRRLLLANFGAWVLRVLALALSIPWWQRLSLV